MKEPELKIGAPIKLPSIFSSHMVLQNGVPLPVWGRSGAGEEITVSFKGQQARTVADDQGRWRVTLPAFPVSSQGRNFFVRGKSNVMFRDVLVGEVWLCSGQSNMWVSQENIVSPEVEKSGLIRFFNTMRRAFVEPLDTTKGKWGVCQKEVMAKEKYSAVGYFFAENLLKARNVPIGMIQAAWGSSAIMPWIDLESLQGSTIAENMVQRILAIRDNLPELLERYRRETLPAWEKSHQIWQQRKSGSPVLSLEKDAETIPEIKNPKEKEPERPEEPGKNRKLATMIYNGMIHPLIPYAIRGVIWYQGENNAQNEKNSEEYAELLPMLISGWRKKWQQGNFPFLFVQLPAYTCKQTLAPFRNSQFKTLAVENTGMAVALDLNPTDNLHPPHKNAVGERLALVARQKVYGEDIVASGPVFKEIHVEGERIRIFFTEIGSGLVIGGPPLLYRRKGKDPSLEIDLKGFRIAADEGAWIPASARIEGDSVMVWNEEVIHPLHVSYAWENYPEANLYNKEGLPAGPFRSDNLPVFLRPENKPLREEKENGTSPKRGILSNLIKRLKS